MKLNIDRDPLGTRIKEDYENRTRYYLPRRTYTVLRLDGCHFKTYTRGLRKPFDNALSEDIDNAIIAMLPQIQGAVFAYTQSDEISILLTDFATPQTDAWFDGNLQKISSVAASIMTAEFNKLRWKRHLKKHAYDVGDPQYLHHMFDQSNDKVNIPNVSTAYFDCRAFTIPDRVEVMNYFRWRKQDCVRNSVSMVAQANFSPKELHGKSQAMMHEMLHQKGVNWETDFTDGEKNGRIIMREIYVQNVVLPKTDKQQARDELSGIASTPTTIYVPRTRWIANGAWDFTKDEGKLLQMIPKYEN